MFFFYFVLQKELYFLCLPGNEEVAVTVREGMILNTINLNKEITDRSTCTAEKLSGRGDRYSSRMTIRISAAFWGVVFRPVWSEMGHTFYLISLKRSMLF